MGPKRPGCFTEGRACRAEKQPQRSIWGGCALSHQSKRASSALQENDPRDTEDPGSDGEPDPGIQQWQWPGHSWSPTDKLSSNDWNHEIPVQKCGLPPGSPSCSAILADRNISLVRASHPPTYRCARGSTSPESFLLHLKRFILGNYFNPVWLYYLVKKYTVIEIAIHLLIIMWLKITLCIFCKSNASALSNFDLQALWQVMFSSRHTFWMGCLNGMRIGVQQHRPMNSRHTLTTICFAMLLIL